MNEFGFDQSPSDMWVAIEHSDYMDRHNTKIKNWAKNCARHQKEGKDD